MKVYFCHSKGFDYQEELYRPVRESVIGSRHEIIFPHEDPVKAIQSKELIRSCDLVFAEVSFPAIGMGIELGWADMLRVPIICFFRSGEQVSGSLQFISERFMEYSSPEELVESMESFLETHEVE